MNEAFVKENWELLGQLVTVLEGLQDTEYSYEAVAVPSSVGAHVRHLCDHYALFFSGLESGCINYDARPVDQRVESDRAYAVATLSDVNNRLENLSVEAAAPVSVRTQVGEGEEVVQSTIARELTFLQSHSTHHVTTIASIIRSAGRDTPEDFGVALSTRQRRAR